MDCSLKKSFVANTSRIIFIVLLSLTCFTAFGQRVENVILMNATSVGKPSSITTANPLDRLCIVNAVGQTITVSDATGQPYLKVPVMPRITFSVSGALGRHTIVMSGKKGEPLATLNFTVDASTSIEDGGRYGEMFKLFYHGMEPDKTGSVTWNGSKYNFFVPWGLDHYHTMKGLKYFLGNGSEFVDLLRQTQREDGMIYSFVQYQSNVDYFRTRDSLTGYTRKIGNKYFIRQPTENHPEYIFVNTIYACWKATGDTAWVKKNLSAASRALDYTVKDDSRWSKRFNLLKRVYTIDSWDFQVEDEYLPDLGLTNTMIIDPVKSKFGVFFGDNTGYIQACHELSEMYKAAGMESASKKYQQRGIDVQNRLDALSWNGRFYTHFIDEDSTVRRKLGVDEKSQLAQSNAYSINRGLDHDKSRAIIESYLDLKANLPAGSPGEWYAIYPPFEKGFERHGDKWQYMNGGVGGHVAGELARGAFENGYEKYGADILERLFSLGKKYDNKIWFAYTGAMQPPPKSPLYRTLNLSSLANMDTWSKGGKKSFPWMATKREGDDVRNLPVGEQNFKDIKFKIIDPSKNDRKAVVAVSKREGFPDVVEIPVNDSARCVYMLHTSTKPTSENISGAISFVYTDGSRETRYMIMGKHLAYWWFSELDTEHSGIAWYGSNAVSKGVGLSWCAIDNPHPEKVISKILLQAPEDNGIYAVLGVTLSNRKHYVPVKPTSFGGPDNWAAATAMAGLIEGMAGVKDSNGTQAFEFPKVSPRWVMSTSDSAEVCVRYAASSGYVSYSFIKRENESKIFMRVTGSGKKISCHVLMPEGKVPAAVTSGGSTVPFDLVRIENSAYADFVIDPLQVTDIEITYK